MKATGFMWTPWTDSRGCGESLGAYLPTTTVGTLGGGRNFVR